MTRRIRDWFQVRNLFAKALAGGAKRLSLTSCEWDIASNCRTPHVTTVRARPDRPINADTARRWKGRTGLEVILKTRCNQCDRCGWARKKLWRMRASAETAAAGRTWFLTLTFRPEERHRLLEVARMRAIKAGDDLDTDSPDRRYRAYERETAREVTLYLKRVREAAGVPFRYMCVAEAHGDGTPHYHLLVHEEVGREIKHACLSGQWRCGFSRVKLAPDNGAAAYIAKYLTKSRGPRVRASLLYGSIALESVANGVKRVKRDPIGNGDMTSVWPTALAEDIEKATRST